VRIGNRSGDKVEVLAGLDDGERVASDPQAARAYMEKRHAEGASTHE
jgi:multidrug efflux pump subunit AcrA (membrane-fusion protein)